jgi:stearoyl-CoA desaturase (delta-9 desaturase)
MEALLSAGVLSLPWWAYVLITLVLTHITIIAVTVFLHRCQAHRALALHPLVSHFFRLWLWLTTGMVTKEWVAIHRKHHAKCDTPEDPHSPQIWGINRVLWGGVFLYVRESRNPATLECYGHATPDDWIERTVYSRFAKLGVVLLGVIDLCLFGIVPGGLIFVTQIVWIPFWAAGVINGIGHYWGYRNWPTPDASTNIVPLGILIGGEELHNNHHTFPSSAKLSCRWYELDIGWLYIRILEALGLARVKRIAPTPRFAETKPVVDVETLQAVLSNHYDVLVRYARSLRRTYRAELVELRRRAPEQARVLKTLKDYLYRDESRLSEPERARVEQTLAQLPALQTAYRMRRELIALWARSMASREQLVRQLQEWCQRAEASNIGPLVEFSQRLRRYA